MSKSLAFRCCGDLSSMSRNILDTLDKDDKEEKKYSAEEKEVDETSLKKSVSERKQDIERRISEEKDKKPNVQPVVMRRSESRERKDKDTKDVKSMDQLPKSEKETCEEKSISPEPANLSFDEKRLSFELGAHTKEKLDKKTELTQKLLDSEKAAYQISGTESEPELTFQEKRLSFEKGLMKSIDEKKPETLEAKTSKKIQMETIVSTESTPKAVTMERVSAEVTETRLLEGVAKELTDFKEKEKLAMEPQGVISPKVSTTPPPSPADVLKAKASEEWKSTPTSDTDGVHKTSAQKPDDSFIGKLLQQEFFKKSDECEEPSPVQAINPLVTKVPPQNVLSDERSFGNPFIDSESPSIFRRPHQATDFVIFDDEDWDTQDVVEFSSVTKQAIPGNIPYAPEKFLEDSSKGELHEEKVNIFEKPLNVEKPKNEDVPFVASALKDLNLPFVPLATTSQSPNEIITATKTTITKIQNSNTPSEIIVTSVETERKYIPSQSQPFVFNDFSKTSDAGDGDSIYECEMNFQKPEDTLNVEESLKIIVDLSESCKTSSEDLVQNVDKSETENLVEIVDVTDEINFETVPPHHDVMSEDNKADLIRRLDECITADFKPRSKNEKKEMNIPTEFKLDNTDISFETVKPSNSSDFNQTTVENKPVSVPLPSSASLTNDARNGRFLGAGGESISRLEDELTLLEQLEDQIRILNEEESKVKISNSQRDEEERHATKEVPNLLNSPSITITREETVSVEYLLPEQALNDDIIEVETQITKSVEELKDEPELKQEIVEEKSKKKKNRKRRSKKHKEDDVDTEEATSPTQEKEQRQFNVVQMNRPSTSQSKVEKNSENEFQSIVSQLSVEEVDEAIQMWNEDLKPLASQSLSEREEEQGPSTEPKSKSKDAKK